MSVQGTYLEAKMHFVRKRNLLKLFCFQPLHLVYSPNALL